MNFSNIALPRICFLFFWDFDYTYIKSSVSFYIQLVIPCCITNYSELSCNLLFHGFCGSDQESESSLMGWFWPESGVVLGLKSFED